MKKNFWKKFFKLLGKEEKERIDKTDDHVVTGEWVEDGAY